MRPTEARPVLCVTQDTKEWSAMLTGQKNGTSSRLYSYLFAFDSKENVWRMRLSMEMRMEALVWSPEPVHKFPLDESLDSADTLSC